MYSLLSLLPLITVFSASDITTPQQGGAGIALSDTDSQTQSLILTPGQNAEIKLTAKPNDVILATVDSQSFDPAVQLQTKDGAVITVNDDVAQGNQSAQIIARLTTEGEYKIVVSGFKGAAGGQFTITTRRFNAPPITGPNNAGDFEDNKPAWRSIPIKKDIPSVIATYGSRRSIPTGFDSRGITIDNRRDAFPFDNGGRFTFESATDQEIYIFIPRGSQKSFSLDVVPVKYESTTIGSTITGNLPRSQAIIYRFKAKAGDLIRAQAGPGRYGYQLTLRAHQLDRKDAGAGIEPIIGQAKYDNQGTFFIHESGEFEALLVHSDVNAKNFELKLFEYSKPWVNNSSAEVLPIGDNLYFKWEMPLGVLLDISATSSVFDLNFSLMAPTGQVIATEDDQGDSTNPNYQMLVTRPGTYYLRVGSYGNGGGGAFNLNRTITLPSEFTSGSAFKATKSKPELRLISAKKGEFFYLAVESSDRAVDVRVYDPTGRQMPISRMYEPSGRQLILVNPEMDGKHLITISTGADHADVKLTTVTIR